MRYSNYVAINAPVNFPHLWTASWFDWVQYDGSIMQPLVRDTGEAMGVRARINTTAPDGQNRFSSSVPVSNLYWIEQALSGDNPFPDGSTEGLGNPFIRGSAKWPEAFGEIDEQASKRGEVLYGNHCAGCHLPPPMRYCTVDTGRHGHLRGCLHLNTCESLGRCDGKRWPG